MKIAIFSDLHANWHAFKACLEHAQNQKYDQIAILGDLIDYGANPEEVCKKVSQLINEEQAWVVKGNHDVEEFPRELVKENILFTHASAYAPERWLYINSEYAAKLCVDSAQKLFFTSHIFVGHVHEQGLYYQGASLGMMYFNPTPNIAIPLNLNKPWVVTVGSVGQPRDGDQRAMYVIYDTCAGAVTFFRVEYDFIAAADAIRKAGLPEINAIRLEKGR